MKSVWGRCVGLLLGCACAGWGATVYVDSGSPVNGPGTGWSNAWHSIQDAVDVATNAGDVVLVTNGVYDTGGAAVPGYALTNRVCITNAITVQSVGGPSNTFIVGVADPATQRSGTA